MGYGNPFDASQVVGNVMSRHLVFPLGNKVWLPYKVFSETQGVGGNRSFSWFGCPGGISKMQKYISFGRMQCWNHHPIFWMQRKELYIDIDMNSCHWKHYSHRYPAGLPRVWAVDGIKGTQSTAVNVDSQAMLLELLNQIIYKWKTQKSVFQ